MMLVERAEQAEAYAEKVRRNELFMVNRRVIEAFLIAIDAWEEAGTDAVYLRAFVAQMEKVESFMWSADTDMLDGKWTCKCCCHEHTHEGCDARMWGGCRGQGSDSQDEADWLSHYERFHGMTREQFYGE